MPIQTESVGSRRLLLPGVIANRSGAPAYAANACVGGLIGIQTGIAQGITLAGTLRLKARTADWTAPTQVNVCMFSDNPTNSTFADNVTGSLAAADMALAFPVGSTTPAGGTGLAVTGSLALPQFPVGLNGFIYMAILANAALTISQASAILYQFDLTF
jgi:hypothetical protein